MYLFSIETALLIIGTGLSTLFILLFFYWRRVKNWNQVPGRVIRAGYKGPVGWADEGSPT
jgi:hypothetical protein